MIKKRDNNTPALDMMFMVALGFLLIIFLMVPFLNPITKQGAVDPPVKLVVSMEWNEENDTDVDLYLMGPDGIKIYYANKNNGHINLKRDDRGISTEGFTIDGVFHPLLLNYESATITQLMDGWYVINVHLFNTPDKGAPESATIKVLDVEKAQFIFEDTVEVSYKQEVTVLSFKVVDGEIVEMDQDVQHKMRR